MPRQRRTKADKPPQPGSAPAAAGPGGTQRIDLPEIWDRRVLAVLAGIALSAHDPSVGADNDQIDAWLPDEVVEGAKESARKRLYYRAAESIKKILPSHFREGMEGHRRVRSLATPLPPHLVRWLMSEGLGLLNRNARRAIETSRVSEAVPWPRPPRPNPFQQELLPDQVEPPAAAAIVFVMPGWRDIAIPTHLLNTAPGGAPTLKPVPETLIFLLDVIEVLIDSWDPDVWHVIFGILVHTESLLEHPRLREDYFYRARYFLEAAYVFYMHSVRSEVPYDDAAERIVQLRRLIDGARQFQADRDITTQARLFEVEGLASYGEGQAYVDIGNAIGAFEDAEIHFRRSLSLWETARDPAGIVRVHFALAEVGRARLAKHWPAGPAGVSLLAEAMRRYRGFMDLHRVMLVPRHLYALAVTEIAHLAALGVARGVPDPEGVTPKEAIDAAAKLLRVAYKTIGPADVYTVWLVDRFVADAAQRIGVTYRARSRPPRVPDKKRIRIKVRIRQPGGGAIDYDLDQPHDYPPEAEETAGAQTRPRSAHQKREDAK